MGFDCGFDIYPRLEANESNKEAYGRFLEEITKKYENVHDKKGRRADGKILTTNCDDSAKPMDMDSIYIWFMVGECPRIPKSPEHCTYFLRFSSKVSGSLTTPAESYIKDVYKIAKTYFGSRVRFWHELNEFGTEQQQYGYYDWNDIHDADKQLEALGTEAQQLCSPPEGIVDQQCENESQAGR
ncbi:hypothetical protein FB567DRAFT_598482 [Paraphoma chrysanthemicola]|uniref:Uncharacterized protein n=1 Tax=Paraphoma chrysanthemicola TaxID=798071 RepID=A0A8K0QTK1_9PLEO|nr:hypothetical protein FB567DRAFT_598482 [Paraphoma chrysanthemicola]